MLTACFQVWFQNKRSKERRLKQLTSMGRGPFFGNSRKMRGFPMNLSPGGLDEAPPGFPYFTTADGKFEFGYGAPAGFHHEFFPGHHPHQGPPGQPLPFNTPGEERVTIPYKESQYRTKKFGLIAELFLLHCAEMLHQLVRTSVVNWQTAEYRHGYIGCATRLVTSSLLYR
jgi:hypothetical protein